VTTGSEETAGAGGEPEERGAAGEAPGAPAAPGAAAEPPGAAGGEDLAPLLEDARSRADQNWDALLRVRAELDNLRKRAEREVENAHRFGLERFVSELLPVKDSLELGHAAATGESVDPEKLREGLELTLKMLSGVLAKFGVEEVDPAGERFDPERHQAMSVQDGSGQEPGTVVMVVQKGYVLNQRLVRPAMVIVAR
jgi:molecular chaperone GrpE